MNRAFWLDSAHVITDSGAILDLNCKPVGSWHHETGWGIAASAASKGWVLLKRTEKKLVLGTYPSMICEIAILDRDSRRPLDGWPQQQSPCGSNTILDIGAEALCSNIGAGSFDKQKLHCWSVDGGEEISLAEKIRRYQIDQIATDSPRVIADRWGYPVLRFETPPLLQVRMVLDLHSGNEIASWKPREQHFYSPYIPDRVYHCALTSKGEYLAESGDGRLELYRIAQ